MKQLRRDLAKMRTWQWMTLNGMMVVFNLVIFGALLTLAAPDLLILAEHQPAFHQHKLAEAIPTRTALPTYTPTLPAWAFPSGNKIKLTTTNTPVPTWTPSTTPTSLPTHTPTTAPPTATPVPVKVAVKRAPPTATPIPTPDVDYIVSVRKLSPCENAGKHHIFVHVRDRDGNGIPGAKVKVTWYGNEAILETGTKMQDPGLTDFAMFKGQYEVTMLGASSQSTGNITPDIPIDEPCHETGNTVGNSLFHYSYEVIFTKVR